MQTRVFDYRNQAPLYRSCRNQEMRKIQMATLASIDLENPLSAKGLHDQLLQVHR